MKAARAVVQQCSSGQPQTWRVLRELTTHGVTYLSGALFVEGSMFLRDSYATMCYFGQPGRVLSQNKWTEKRKKSPFISLYLHYVFQAYIRHYINRYCPHCFNSTDKKHSGSNIKTVSSGDREKSTFISLVKIYATGHMKKCRNVTWGAVKVIVLHNM